MLDDRNLIAQRDPQDALGFAKDQPKQLLHDFGLQSTTFEPVKNVVFAGMGGSALVGEFLKTWPALSVPYHLSKEYDVPAFVNQETLVICASYSGNTEETISAYEEARQKKAQIVVITHGGKLADLAHEHGIVHAEIPHCPQPRTSVFYAYRGFVEILIAARLVPAESLAQLESLVAPLELATSAWTADVPEGRNPAKQLAQKMVGKTPIIYAGPLMAPAAYKWKIDANENAKNTAWCNSFPEFNHNEFLGWSSHPVEKPFAVIDLLSNFEKPRILQRFELTDRLLSGKRPAATSVQAVGESTLEHLLYLVLLGDFATTYLGILNGVDPTPVDLVEKFKKELG